MTSRLSDSVFGCLRRCTDEFQGPFGTVRIILPNWMSIKDDQGKCHWSPHQQKNIRWWLKTQSTPKCVLHDFVMFRNHMPYPIPKRGFNTMANGDSNHFRWNGSQNQVAPKSIIYKPECFGHFGAVPLLNQEHLGWPTGRFVVTNCPKPSV